MTFDGGFSSWQLVAGAVQLSFVTGAEGVNGEATDWLMRTSNCGKEFEVSDKEMKEGNRTYCLWDTEWLTLEGLKVPISVLLTGQFRVK